MTIDCGPKDIPEKLEHWVLALENQLPLFKKLWPDGMKDFRQGIPAGFQSGVFLKVGSWRECKAKFGSEENARKAAIDLMQEFDIEATVVPPHVVQLNVGPTRNDFWTVTFFAPEELAA